MAVLKKQKTHKCIVELYGHAGFFRNTREVLEKHELQVSASLTSQVFLKNPKFFKNNVW